MRSLRSLVVLVSMVVGMLMIPGTAGASCAIDLDDPPYTLKKMIRRGETGDEYFHRLLLGHVRRIRDPGDPGGDVIVRLRVREVPFGPAREWARIRDWTPEPGVGVSDNIDFERGRYAVVARQRADGTFVHDGPCGQTEHLKRYQLRTLIHLSRHG